MGQYLSTDRILNSRSFDAQNLVRSLPGVVVDNGGVVHVNRGVTTLIGTPCKGAQVLLDGVAMAEGFDIRLIPIESIRGIELYSGAATVPAELKAARSSCGTLAVWTW
jgi:outer membrane receptor protein involved in Fe transport